MKPLLPWAVAVLWAQEVEMALLIGIWVSGIVKMYSLAAVTVAADNLVEVVLKLLKRVCCWS